MAATIAIVMTDIKKVLAYSTVSQLGYMMLALGVGGWAAGLFHLITHAFFKALLFLGSGSVIYGCHHEQDMLKMGGLFPKMKITALTMLVGVLAIAGIPLFTRLVQQGRHPRRRRWASSWCTTQHVLLFLLPLVTAGITTFYMFRMWFMTFTGKPRDQHVYEHAHESPWLMTVPLIVLAVLSVVRRLGLAARGTPRRASWSTAFTTRSRASVMADFGTSSTHDGGTAAGRGRGRRMRERHRAHELHGLAGDLALAMRGPRPRVRPRCLLLPRARPGRGEGAVPGRPPLPAAQVVLRRALQRAAGAAGADRRRTGAAASTCTSSTASSTASAARRVAVAELERHVRQRHRRRPGQPGRPTSSTRIGAGLRNVQTGYLRSYVLFLVAGGGRHLSCSCRTSLAIATAG